MKYVKYVFASKTDSNTPVQLHSVDEYYDLEQFNWEVLYVEFSIKNCMNLMPYQ